MQNTSFAEKNTIFERHPKKTLCMIVILLLCFIELFSFGILMIKNLNTLTKTRPYNRMISGYYVYKNVPGFRFGTTIKRDPNDADVVVDQYGFISDETLTRTKNKNTIRIFLMGGSALIGAGQESRARRAGATKYPDGIYTYRLSIAGYLKEFLKRQRPELNFEVINSAAYMRTFNLSMGLYAESVSRFSPDYVVNMDGYNDKKALADGLGFYADGERQLEKLVNLEVAFRSMDVMKYSNTFRLVRYLLQRNILGEIALDPPQRWRERKEDDYPWKDYYKNRARYIENSNRFIQILQHYMALLKSDDVKFVFVVQPNLNRVNGNKELSSDEFKLRDKMYPPTWDETEEKLMHRMLVLKYFFGDYLSERIQTAVEGKGFDFIDMGLKFQELDASITAYTDYCHLTPEANQFIAEKIGEIILKRESSQKLVESLHSSVIHTRRPSS